MIVPAVTVSSLEKVCEELTQVAGKKPTYDYQVGNYLGRRYPVGHIYLTHSGFPFVVEFFQNFLGYESVRLAPFLVLKEKWGLWIQALSPEAIIGSRLAFRLPERITPFNAARLNRLIRAIGTINWSQVNTFIDTFELRIMVQENLAELKRKRISITGSSKIAQQHSKLDLEYALDFATRIGLDLPLTRLVFHTTRVQRRNMQQVGGATLIARQQLAEW